MDNLKVLLNPGEKECKGYEPIVLLTLFSNTTIKYIKDFT